MQEIGIGVIGVGKMGEIHVQAYIRNPLAKLIAVADINENRAREIGDRYNLTAYTDFNALLKRDDIEAVSICTNDDLHLEPTIAALEAGKHVLLEKPIATTLADADKIIAAMKDCTLKFMVGHIVRFDPRYAKVKDEIERGTIGEIESIFARRLNAVSAQNVLKGRVSVLSFLGVHDFDIMRWLANSEVTQVHTESISRLLKSQGYDVEDNTFTLLRFASGTIGCAELGWILPDTHPRKADFKLEVIGRCGVANIDLYEQGLTICAENQSWTRPSFGHSIDVEVRHFLNCIITGEAPLVTPEDARAALEISLAAQLSAERSKIITLPLTE